MKYDFENIDYKLTDRVKVEGSDGKTYIGKLIRMTKKYIKIKLEDDGSVKIFDIS